MVNVDCLDIFRKKCSFNPWLMQAKKAEREGDMGKKEYYISKFFELFPAFAGNKKTKYWRGHRAVLL